MIKSAFLSIAVLCLAMLVPIASAHVSLIYPVGGESFVPGTEVTIEWRLNVSHGDQDWDLYFSSDGGASWSPIQLNLPVSLHSYQWTVPQVETTQGRIKVVQDNTGLDYEDRCNNFSIVAAATAIDGSSPLPGSIELFASYPNPFSASTAIDFVLEDAEDVLLEVFDVQGVKVAELIAAPLAPGRHHVKWQPNGLATGVYIYRLAVRSSEGAGGIRVQTKPLTIVR